MEGRWREMAEVMGERSRRGKTWKGEEQMQEGSGKEWKVSQSAVRTCCDGYFRTAMLIQQLFIDKYCFWPASETKFTLVLVQKSSRMCDLNFPGPQLIIPGSGTTGRDTITRGKCSLMGWKVGSAAFQNKVTTAWNIALVNFDLELLLPGWLLTSFTKETQGHCLPSWITKRANKKYFLGPIRFSTECSLKA